MIDVDPAAEPLALFAQGRAPAGLAAMRLLMASGSLQEAKSALHAAERRFGARRLHRLNRLLTPRAFEVVHGVLAAADHGAQMSPQDWAAAFDRAAEVSPDAAVALYSLGDAGRLKAATDEIVDWLRRQGLLGRRRRVLEIGCGHGRFLRALAPQVALAVGLDVSARMTTEAARRCRGLTGVGVVRTGGCDLAAFADGCVDLVLAIDSFPYLVNAGCAYACLNDAVRVLAPGGDLLILNWSYEDPAAAPDTPAGLRRLPLQGPELALWDGVGFRFQKV